MSMLFDDLEYIDPNKDVFSMTDYTMAKAGVENLFTANSPTSEEVSTEVDEEGNVVETLPRPQLKYQAVVARCPMLITSTETDGKMTRIVHAYIRGPIDDLCGYVPLIDTLNRATEDFVFYIHIQSGGGMVTTGATIASAINSSKAHVVTIAEGLCASAASLIWSSGDECLVGDYAMFMYHMSSHADMNNSVQVADSALKMVHYVRFCLMKNALSKGHITPEQHQTFCENREDVWISAKEMREHLAAAKAA